MKLFSRTSALTLVILVSATLLSLSSNLAEARRKSATPTFPELSTLSGYSFGGTAVGNPMMVTFSTLILILLYDESENHEAALNAAVDCTTGDAKIIDLHRCLSHFLDSTGKVSTAYTFVPFELTVIASQDGGYALTEGSHSSSEFSGTSGYEDEVQKIQALNQLVAPDAKDYLQGESDISIPLQEQIERYRDWFGRVAAEHKQTNPFESLSPKSQVEFILLNTY